MCIQSDSVDNAEVHLLTTYKISAYSQSDSVDMLKFIYLQPIRYPLTLNLIVLIC